MTLSRPSLAAVDEFLDLFDAVTGTFRFVTIDVASAAS